MALDKASYRSASTRLVDSQAASRAAAMTRRAILVVDDDPNIRETMSIHLRNAGYDVRTAKDGIEAGYAVLRKRPDLIIMDTQMPYMDGFELFAALRADEETRSIPVLMLTTETEWNDKARQLPVNGYVSKPIFADKLLALVATHVPALESLAA